MIEQTYPSLPDGMKRFEVERLILEVGPHIGLRPGAIQALLQMIRATRPTDWIKDDREPVYFASQATLSMELAKTPRAIRNIENRLESASLIEKRVKANGHRGRSGGCGITFRRLIRAIPALIDLAQRIKDGKRLGCTETPGSVSDVLQHAETTFTAGRTNARSGLFQPVVTDPSGGITEREIHLSRGSELFKQTEPPLRYCIVDHPC